VIASGGAPKPGLNLINIVKDYIDNMLSEMQGRKALILDKETLSITNITYHSYSYHINGLFKNSNSIKGGIFH
jgi:hypothetical protein